jgi:hypothetical protein
MADELHIGLSTLERRIVALKNLGAIRVTQRGPTSSVYSVLWRKCDTWQCFLKLAAENEGASQKSTNQTVRAENEGASEGAFEGALGVASITDLPSEDRTASLAECAREPTSQRKLVNQENLADFIREGTRFPIGGKVADEGTVKRLASILGDVEVYKHFQVMFHDWCRNNTPRSWGIVVVLARDAAASVRDAQRFVTAAEVRAFDRAAGIADPKNEEALRQFEQERQQEQEFIDAATARGLKLILHGSNCRNCYGFGQRDNGDVCDCEAGRQLDYARAWCGRCENTGIVAAAADPLLFAWCDCDHAAQKREREPDAAEDGNRAVTLLRSTARSRFGQQAPRKLSPVTREEATIPTVAAIRHQIRALAAKKGLAGTRGAHA